MTAKKGVTEAPAVSFTEAMRELGVDTRWVVIETDRVEFFALTKHVHNLIHGAGEADLGPAERALFESVNAENAAELLSQPDIDGALVGGASLKADQFAVIVKAARA